MKIMLLFCCALLSLTVFAQQAPVTVRSEQNPDRTYTLYAENRSDAEYTIKLLFTLAGYTTNLSGNPALTVVQKGNTAIAKLSPDKMATAPTFSYTYQYFPGPSLRKAPDTSTVYLFPGTAGNMLVASRVGNLAQMMGQKTTDNYSGTAFLYQFGDTICATRAGTVFESFDGMKEGESHTFIYKSSRNHLSIQHKDGTMSHYSILAPIKLLVNDGDNVVPGQPVAVFNKESDKYTLLYAVRYLDEKKLQKEIDLTKTADYYVYIHPVFYMGDVATAAEPGKTYTVEYSRELIAKELSKKEKKKLGLQ